MEHFNDFLNFQSLDYSPRIVGIEKMLNQKVFLYAPIEVIGECFLTWAKKPSYNSLFELQGQTGIQRIVDNACNHKQSISKDDLIYYLEYVLTILDIPSENTLSDYVIIDYNPTSIYAQVQAIIKELNCKLIKKDGGYYIMPANAKLEIASKITGNKYDLDRDMLLFSHPSVRNSLTAKADILCRIYKFLESKETLIKSYNHTSMYSDVSKLMDGLDIRHAPNKKEKELLAGMSKKELLGWYEQLFGMCVSLIILIEYSAKRRDVKELKSKLG